jgi:UDP-N-acetylglucosamine--N-acetylmuramyl-(pentapeptide) pyrophosphoryl-undecaprenol N-acetylglucosamine transferase
MENRLVPQAGFGLMRVKVGALKNVSLITRMRTLFDLPRAVVDPVAKAVLAALD